MTVAATWSGPRSCAVVGDGRAGRSFSAALREVGWSVDVVRARSLVGSATAGSDSVAPTHHVERATVPDSVARAALVLLTVPDGALGAVARAIGSVDGVVAHVSGASGLDVLAPHARVGSLHPLMSLPDETVGARRLLDGCTFAIDGDALMQRLVDDLGGRAVSVPDGRRALYHATATVAANHLTALCAQVERLAERVGIPIDAYRTLMSTTLQNVADVGAADALTGPAARGDWSTVRAHLDAVGDDERDLYLALALAAARLAGHDEPPIGGRPAPPSE